MRLLRVMPAFSLLLCTLSCGGGDGTTAPVEDVDSVVITPAEVSLIAGETRQFSAVTRTQAGRVLNGRPIAWTSAPLNVATITQAGLVTPRRTPERHGVAHEPSGAHPGRG